MATQGTVTRLVQDLRSEDSGICNRAAQLIWERYFHDLLELARNNLSRKIRRRVDEEDVLQSMYKSFCLRQQRGEFDLAGRDALWKLLMTITLNKARNVARDQGREIRNPDREQAIPGDDERESQRWALEQMEAAGPSPAEAAVLNEALELRLDALTDPELRQIALWKLEGYTNREIAVKLGCVERTVERKVGLIKAKWKALEDPGRDDTRPEGMAP
jgi:RNA polymerase sigma factor (sigma-70 family)